MNRGMDADSYGIANSILHCSPLIVYYDVVSVRKTGLVKARGSATPRKAVVDAACPVDGSVN